MYSAIARNKRNTVLIILAFLLIVGALGFLGGYLAGNVSVGVIVLLVALGYAVLQYFLAGRQATAIAGGIEIDRSTEPRLWRTVENLAITTGMPMPRVFVIDDPAPNAFATGRDPDHAIVAATTGLLAIMDDTELQASWRTNSGTSGTTTSASRRWCSAWSSPSGSSPTCSCASRSSAG